MKLEGANVLVTGGAGFIGSHLVELLVERGCQVTVLDNFRNGLRENLAGVSDASRLRVIHGDITDATTCHRACPEGGVVFHLACLGVRHSLHNPVENHQVNALGSLNVLEAARAQGVQRFVYVSTSEVYGRATSFPITESTATWPLTVYGASKLAGEHYARAYFECFGVPAVRVRPFNNFGPRSHFEGDAGEVIPRFLLRALAGKAPAIFGDGSHTRDFLYVKDCAEALWQIAECDQLAGDLVNLGHGEEMTIGALARLAVQAAGRKDLAPIHEPERPADVPRLWVDSTKLRETTGFRPRTTFEEGLRATFEYFSGVLADDPTAADRIGMRNWEE
jgi:UDP-glucose 4-epimerase